MKGIKIGKNGWQVWTIWGWASGYSRSDISDVLRSYGIKDGRAIITQLEKLGGGG